MKDLSPTVTTGPLPASRRVWHPGVMYPEIRVPSRLRPASVAWVSFTVTATLNARASLQRMSATILSASASPDRSKIDVTVATSSLSRAPVSKFANSGQTDPLIFCRAFSVAFSSQMTTRATSPSSNWIIRPSNPLSALIICGARMSASSS